MSRIIGIDLGTTFSVAAFMAEDGPKLIPNELGESLTPSVVGIDQNGEILVGKSAKELQVTQPDRCASVFKRYMGTDWTTVLNGRVFTPEKLSSLVLMSLKRDAESHLGESIDQAVITVPAYFNEHQRKATIRAGEIAGLKVQRILNEPTAAAIAYGLHSSKDEQNFAVLDLGGGTFDISVVELFEGALEVKATSGETFLGGVDFTNCLAARVLERQGLVFEQVETKSPKLISRLFQECEQAKRRLSKQSNVSIRVPDENGEFHDKSPRVDVSCDEFEEWTSRILKRIESPIRRALGDARIKREEVDELILVGGATRMPAVVRRVAEIFGQQPICRLNPDEVVALGAAVQASLFTRDASVDDLVVTDVAPFTLGIESTRSVAGEYQDGYFLPIISRNTTIPTSRVERVGTLYPNQTLVNVRVFQGEARRTVDNLFLGEFAVDGIPRGAAGQAVDIRFTYDLNGILEIEATILATSKKITHIIARHAKGLSPEEIARAVSEMTALKFHPREESVNRYLVRRAERIYQELPTDGRRFLDSLLSGFEEALEYRDPSAIESNRSLLEQFLNQFDSEEPNEEEFEGG